MAVAWTSPIPALVRSSSNQSPTSTSTSVILAGPYGQSILNHELMQHDVNILCIAGGTGVTFVLPVLLQLICQQAFPSRRGLLEFIWIIRRKADMRWIKDEMEELLAAAEGCPSSNFRMRVFVTREGEVQELNQDDGDVGKEVVKEGIRLRAESPSSTSADGEGAFTVLYMGSGSADANRDREIHPDVGSHVTDFVSRTVHGPTRVLASGPTGLISDLRSGVASGNDPAKVWKGEKRYDVQLVHDDRLEW